MDLYKSPLKTIIYSGPGPSFKGTIKTYTHRVFETDWLKDREQVKKLCADFASSYVDEFHIYDQPDREAKWDF